MAIAPEVLEYYRASAARFIVALAAEQLRCEARYPVASPALPLSERMAADERTLQAVIRERSARQAGLVVTRE